jgi:hypothetical protein
MNTTSNHYSPLHISVYVSVEKLVNVFLDYRAPMKEQPYYWPLRLQGKSREARKYVNSEGGCSPSFP